MNEVTQEIKNNSEELLLKPHAPTPPPPKDDEIKRLRELKVTAPPITSTNAIETGFIAKHGDATNQVLKVSPALRYIIASFSSFMPLKEQVSKAWNLLPLKRRMRWQKGIFSEYLARFESLMIGPKCYEKMLTELSCDLLNRGYLTSENDLSKTLEQNREADSATITSIGLVSGNRADSLIRAAESYGKHCQDHGRSTRIVVCDDSMKVETRNEYKEKLKKLSKQYSFPIRYVGLEEKLLFADKLAKKGFNKDLVNFAFVRSNSPLSAYGKNRNALQLACSGEMYLSADDDTKCVPHQAENYESGVEFTGPQGALLSIKPYASRQEALDSHPILNECVLDLHERVLGKNLATTVLDNSGEELCTFDPNATYAKRLLCKGKGRVNLSFNGLLGDSGSGEQIGHMFIGEKEKQTAFQSEAFFNKRKIQRDVYKSTEKIRITRRDSCMTTFYSVDARKGTPPFFPFYRMEDAIFAHLMQLCDPTGFQAHLPWELEHLPLEKRERSLMETKANYYFSSTHEILTTALDMASMKEYGDNYLAENQRRLSDLILDFCGQNTEDFNDVMLMKVIQKKTNDILRLEALLIKNKNYPKYWKAEVKRNIKSLQNQIQGYILLGEGELLGVVKPGELGKISRIQLINFANLMKIWPDMLEACNELKQEGHSLGIDI